MRAATSPRFRCCASRSARRRRGANDIGRKKSVYEAHGVPELWLVDDVASVVLVFGCSAPDVTYYDTALELDGDDTLCSPLLPGFELALAELFA